MNIDCEEEFRIEDNNDFEIDANELFKAISTEPQKTICRMLLQGCPLTTIADHLSMERNQVKHIAHAVFMPLLDDYVECRSKRTISRESCEGDARGGRKMSKKATTRVLPPPSRQFLPLGKISKT